jgi:2-C-methyl-D-erythritol 4-phosphate cytidylyltransferase/2-C-methyl-D-erythritol 4-phosphate cytidylyltransferase/2-C-methyl-D-erythritol 2,4-cyclodiphosphate synthase
MNHVIILAAGQGQRTKTTEDKLLIQICGKPLVYYTIMAFNDHPDIDSMTIVANKKNKEKIEEIIKLYNFPKVKKIILGGETRQKSSEKGILSLKNTAKPTDIILVHNGANPLPSQEEITKVIEQSKKTGTCISGHFVTSTIKEIKDAKIIKTHNRKALFSAETPQAATYKIMQKAYANAKKKNLIATDEAMMLEAIGQKVAFVVAHENNFKITTQSDLMKLKAILGDFLEDFRVGIGQDSHIFEEKKKGLTLCGITLPNEPKLKANSDGDVVLHAIFNALSQAIGDMSLGFYADKKCEEGIKDSKKYIEIILKKMKKQNLKPNSLGVMIEAKIPLIDPLVPQMKKSLSSIIDLNPRKIGITATTGEKCSVFGKGLGIQCFAIISLIKEKNNRKK